MIDLSARYEFADDWQVRVGIVNLLDEEPPEWTTGSVADPALYDSLYHAAAVVGLNTSAMIEAGILGKSVFTIQTQEFAGGQEPRRPALSARAS